MTRQRNYNARCETCNRDALCPECGKPVSSATPFSDWLREQARIDSSLGYVTTNVDFLWSNHKTGRWIFLEEKRHGGRPSWSQARQFRELDAVVKDAPGYGGFWILRFERTTPDDGKIWLARLDDADAEIEKSSLLAFLAGCGDTIPLECIIARHQETR
jgi:hypothetical protein